MQTPFCAIMRSWTLLAVFGGSYAPGLGKSKLVELTEYLIDNVYVKAGNRVYRIRMYTPARALAHLCRLYKRPVAIS